MNIQIKRVYEKPVADDGLRILIDRLWPRGLTKEKAGVDLWLKDIAPSAKLRKWFNHEEDKWEEFKERYREEVNHQPENLQLLIDMAKRQKITLVYSAKNERHNDAVALYQFLENYG